MPREYPQWVSDTQHILGSQAERSRWDAHVGRVSREAIERSLILLTETADKAARLIPDDPNEPAA